MFTYSLDATLTRSSLALVTRPKGQPCARTGGIDCTWKKIKDQIPLSIHTRKKGNINKDLMAYVRQCQGTAETACWEWLPGNDKSKWACEGTNRSWPTQGSKTVVKHKFYKKNMGAGRQYGTSFYGWSWCKWLLMIQIPSGELTVCYWKLPFIVDFPMKNGDFP